MEKRIKLMLREPHLYWGNEGFHIVDYVAYTDKVTIPVVDGVAYAPVTDSRHYALLAALKEPPEEVAKIPGVTLHYAELKENKDDDDRADRGDDVRA